MSIFEFGFMTQTIHFFTSPDARSANFRSALHSALMEITQRLSASSSKLIICINICIGKLTDPSCKMTTRQSPFWGKAKASTQTARFKLPSCGKFSPLWLLEIGDSIVNEVIQYQIQKQLFFLSWFFTNLPPSTRCLILKTKSEQLWKKLNEMEAHNEIR